MKITNLALSLVLASGLVGCSQIAPVPRDQLSANLAPILKIEKRADGVKYYTQMLRTVGEMSEEGAGKLKAHYDIYYIYWMAAVFNLANGNMDSYLANLKLAEKELNAMETILKDQFAQLGEANSKRKDVLSGLGL
ncbi:MAG: hypothetical protein ACREQA_14075 [Candidatus Binatia bacterium]